MFEQVGQRAEWCATRLARRAFFGKLAQAALPVAAAIGGLLALPRDTQAIGRGFRVCCYSDDGSVVCALRPHEQYLCPAGTTAGRCHSGPGSDAVPLCWS